MKLLLTDYNPFYVFREYDLDRIIIDEKPAGLSICYSLVSNPWCMILSVSLQANETIAKWHRKHTKESLLKVCPNINTFLAVYDTSDFGLWEVDVLYKGTYFKIRGTKTKTTITVYSHKEHKTMPDDLLLKVEKELS